LNVGHHCNVSATNQPSNVLEASTIDNDDDDVIENDDVIDDESLEKYETVDRLVLNDEARGKYNFRTKLKIPIKYRSEDEEMKRNSSKSPKGRIRSDESESVVGLSDEDFSRSDSEAAKKIDFREEDYFNWMKNQVGGRPKKKVKRSSRSPRLDSSSSMSSDIDSQRFLFCFVSINLKMFV
jgi:hypothetical protein